MGWPVSLACVHSHYCVRYDDGRTVFNIEPTCTGHGIVWGTDEEHIKKHDIPPLALGHGSDLKALTPRERLAVFIGLRARFWQDLFYEIDDTACLLMAEREYLLARYLYPAQRRHHRQLCAMMGLAGAERFEQHEPGHPSTYLWLLKEVYEMCHRKHDCQKSYPPPERPGDSVVERRSLSKSAPQVLGSM